jgi:putative transposase
MPNTYSQIYIQVVFAVKDRTALIRTEWDEQLYRYITGIVQNHGQKMLAINGTADHVHFLIGMRPSCCLSDLVREVKKSSNEFINENKFTKFNFSWQEGFGAFSYGQSQLNVVCRYVLNQKKHHAKRTFRAEYEELLHKFAVEFEDEYLFEWIQE